MQRSGTIHIDKPLDQADDGPISVSSDMKSIVETKNVELTHQEEQESTLDHSFDEIIEREEQDFEESRLKVGLSWHNINIDVKAGETGCCKKVRTPSKTILSDVSGCVLPGQFLSIIGASGAGKTTLLNHLSGRLFSQNLEITGEIRVNDQLKETVPKYGEFSAYIQQDDVLYQTMSVRECVEFAAKLRMQGSEEQRNQKIERLLTDLKLTKCQNTKIGGELVKGVSGGERKRTSIAVELITDPCLIFLDEPTTGLDSYTSTQLMDTLQSLARSGKTIIQTIHQPNSDIFDRMDQLMLLAKGKTIYFNQKSLAVDYFKGIGFACPELSNPSDYFMSIMSKESIEVELEDTEEHSDEKIAQLYAERINHFDQSYQNSELKNNSAEMLKDIDALKVDANFSNRVSWCQEFILLARRNILNQIRLPQVTLMSIFQTIVISLLCLLIYSGLDQTKAGIQDRNGALFFITINAGFAAVGPIGMVFPSERPVFIREVTNGTYRTSSYFWGKILSQLPMQIFIPFLQSLICYYGIGFDTGLWYKFPRFFIVLLLEYNAFAGFGYILGASFKNKVVINIVLPIIVVPQMLFAGFFVNQDNIPWFFLPFKYVSIFKYAYQANFLNEYEDLTLECMSAQDPRQNCGNPIADFDSPEGIGASMLVMLGIGLFCYLVAFSIMMKITSKNNQ